MHEQTQCYKWLEFICTCKSFLCKVSICAKHGFQFENRRSNVLKLLSKESVESHVHPKSGDSDKFFVGDRFHEANVMIDMIGFILFIQILSVSSFLRTLPVS